MANLNKISAHNLGEAASILEAVSGSRPAPRKDYPPYIEEAVAGGGDRAREGASARAAPCPCDEG